MSQAPPQARDSRRRRTTKPGGGAVQPPRLHLGRLIVLALVLIAGAFYVGPLREFFVQQDRFHQQSVALEEARAANEELNQQVQLLNSEAYISQRALEGSRLVPPNTQVFIINGLPDEAAEEAPVDEGAATSQSLSVLDRLEDLWRTLFK